MPKLPQLFRRIVLTKREKFAIITALLTIGLVATQLVNTEDRLKMVIILFLATYVSSAWALSEDLSGIEWFTLLILPSFYTAAVALFYFLLPVRWLTRLPVAVIYAVGMYALLLIGNIYNVAAGRSIQLVRAAHTIGLLLSVASLFFIFNTVFALHLPAYLNAILIFVFLVPLTYQALWVMTLERRVSLKFFVYSLAFSLSIAEIGLILSFWPVKGIILSLFIATLFYGTIGLAQQQVIERMFPATIRTFLFAIVFVFIILSLTTTWGG